MDDEELFDGPEDDAFEQDGPGLFDEPVIQEGPGLLDGAETEEPSVPESPRSTRPSMPSTPLALYRRYRPDTFAEVIGQEHVTDPLQRALQNNRVNHAYLFSGPRGCGKTTSARILARCLNCEQGPTPTPCGACQPCRDLATGGPGSIDVIEIDAASHGGVDDARDLRERAFFAPVSSRYKIYIVDEAHMVTPAGFNALLKLVEEPPPHVKFIFATTEPEKVIGTIRSRTHHYPFRLVPPKVLGAYLSKICAEEGVGIEPTVVPLVVRAGAGSVRDSLSVLDQLLGGAGESGVTYQQATGLLGFTPDSLLDEMCDALAAGDAEGVFSSVDKVIEVGQDPKRFAEDLLRRLRDLVVVAAVPDAVATGLVDVAGDQGERLTTQAAGFGMGELTRAAGVISTGLTEMRGTTAPRLHLELMCARVLLPGADADERGLHARLERVERRLAMVGTAPVAETVVAPESDTSGVPEKRPVGSQASTDHAVTRPHDGDRRRGAPEPVPSSEAQRGSDRASGRPSGRRPAVGRVTQMPTDRDRPAPDPSGPVLPKDPVPTREDAVPDPRVTSASRGADPLDAADIRRLWPKVLDLVQQRRRFTWIMLSQNAQVKDVRDGVLTLAMANPGARDSWSRGGNEDILHEALIEAVGVDLAIEAIVDGAGAGSTPPSGNGRGPRADGPRSSTAAPGTAHRPQDHQTPAAAPSDARSAPSSSPEGPAEAASPVAPLQSGRGTTRPEASEPATESAAASGRRRPSASEAGSSSPQTTSHPPAGSGGPSVEPGGAPRSDPGRDERTERRRGGEAETRRRRPAKVADDLPEPPPFDDEPPPEDDFDPYASDSDQVVTLQSRDALLRETLGASRIDDEPEP